MPSVSLVVVKISVISGERGILVVKALGYKLEGSGFKTR
jgi:hypothetical protein